MFAIDRDRKVVVVVDPAAKRIVAQSKLAGGPDYVGCGEGKAVSLDVARAGVRLGEARTGAGVDAIAYGPALSHLYVPGGATLTVLGVGVRGDLAVLGTLPAAPDAHCAAADDRGNVYVCAPRDGRVLVVHDPYPASR